MNTTTAMGNKAGIKVDVLVVEDDPELRATVTELLDDCGYAVAFAANGAEAMELLEARVIPSVILLDLEMPVMSGWEFLRVQRRRGSLARIPVVLVTGTEEEPIVRRQVAGQLEKPTLMQDLVRTVERFVKPASASAPRAEAEHGG